MVVYNASFVSLPDQNLSLSSGERERDENTLTKGRKFHKRNAREEKWRMGEKEIDRLWTIKSAQQKKVGRLELLGDYKRQRSHSIITSNEPRWR